MDEKPLVWVAGSQDAVRNFPDDARRRAGFELYLVQRGLKPTDFKPMPDVGAGVYELRIRTALEHRIFYIAKYEEAVYVLHAMEKKSQKTLKRDLDLARDRLALVTHIRSTARRIHD